MEDEEIKKLRAKRMEEMMNNQNKGVIELNTASFGSFIQSDVPVVVDFWASWCMPCRIMAPVMEELAQAYAGKALFGKVNVDENQQIAGQYGIMSIPQFLIFKNGVIVEKLVGAVGREPLENAIMKHL